MRLDKYLTNLGTRSEIKKLLKTGVVTVNGTVCKKGDTKIAGGDEVLLNGKRVVYKEFIYLIMNKPSGLVSATWDKKQKCVVDILSDKYKRFNPSPVGRLDIDTEGLLILTNDGELNHNLTSPKKDVKKTYFTRIDIPMTEDDITAFSKGMDLGDFTAKPAVLEITDNPSEVFITISEGKFHQVKRMCAKCGKNVIYLKRVSIGGLTLDDGLALGDVAELSKDELIKLINI